MSNLAVRLIEGREAITGEKLNEVRKKENRIKYAADKLVRILERTMISWALRGNSSAFTFASYQMGEGDVIKEFNIEGEEESVFQRALEKAKKKHKGKGIKFKLGRMEDTGSRKLIAEW